MPYFKCKIKETTWYNWDCVAEDAEDAEELANDFASSHDALNQKDVEYSLAVEVEEQDEEEEE